MPIGKMVNLTKKPLNTVEKTEVKKIVTRAITKYAEMDFRDIANNVLINTSGTVLKLSDPIAVGTGQSNRIGQIVRAKKLEVRMNIKGGTAQTSYANVRCVIVKDNQRTYGAPTYPSVFESAVPESPILYTAQNSKRWTVLFDRYIGVAPNAAAFQANPVLYNFKTTIKLDHDIMWDQGDVPGKGHLYLVLISDIGTNVATFNPNINHYMRLHYLDA